MTRRRALFLEPATRHVIERTTCGPVEVLRLAHGKVSAIDVELLVALSRALDEAAESPALVLVGSGRIFSAGVDLFRLLAGGPAYVRELLPTLSATLAKLFFHSRPVVAAVNGPAIAGGCVLACACDYRVMARGPGRIGVTELLVGLPFPAVALEVMRFAATPPRFQEIIYRGAVYTPEDARLCGLVDELTADAEVLDRACRVAEALAAIPPASFALSKRHLRQPVRDLLDAHGAAIDAEVTRVWTSPEAREAVRRYVEHTFGAKRLRVAEREPPRPQAR